MIDKLNLRLPATARLRGPVADFIREGEQSKIGERARYDSYYDSMTDLRAIEIDAVFHHKLKRERTAFTGTHKLSILQTGSKGYSDCCAIIDAVMEGRQDPLEIMRLDLAADLPGVPVSYFPERIRIPYKRVSGSIGRVKNGIMGKTGVETLAQGKHPCMFRIYDKPKERWNDYQKICRKERKKTDPVEFELLYGMRQNDIITRFEREYGSGRIPSPLRTFGDLHRAPDWNPFAKIEIIDGLDYDVLIQSNELSPEQIMSSIGARYLFEKWGLQAFARWYNTGSKGNWSRFKKSHPEVFSTSSDVALLLERVVQIYKESTIRQLAA